jgi:hypothetical protein
MQLRRGRRIALILESISYTWRYLRYEGRTHVKRKHSHVIPATPVTGAIKYPWSAAGRRAASAARRAGRPGAAAAVAVTVIAGTSLMVPQANAEGGLDGNFFTAFDSASNTLTIAENGRTINATNLGLDPGTHPSIASNGSTYVVAFQANGNFLSILGPSGFQNLGLGMMPGTSPAITIMQNGAYEIAFQANTGTLWTVSNAGGGGNTGQPMNPKSSPSITAQNAGPGYQIAYERSDNGLWTYGVSSGFSSFFMQPGTSPAIAAPQGGGWEVAFQASNTSLGVYGNAATNPNLGLGMDPASSPAITGVIGPSGSVGFSVAFQANTHVLWTAGAYGTRNLNQPMAPGTNPSITGIKAPACGVVTHVPETGFDTSFEGPDGLLHGETDTISPASGASFIPYTYMNEGFGSQTMFGQSSPSETSIGQSSVSCGVPIP